MQNVSFKIHIQSTKKEEIHFTYLPLPRLKKHGQVRGNKDIFNNGLLC